MHSQIHHCLKQSAWMPSVHTQNCFHLDFKCQLQCWSQLTCDADTQVLPDLRRRAPPLIKPWKRKLKSIRKGLRVGKAQVLTGGAQVAFPFGTQVLVNHKFPTNNCSLKHALSVMQVTPTQNELCQHGRKKGLFLKPGNLTVSQYNLNDGIILKGGKRKSTYWVYTHWFTHLHDRYQATVLHNLQMKELGSKGLSKVFHKITEL